MIARRTRRLRWSKPVIAITNATVLDVVHLAGQLELQEQPDEYTNNLAPAANGDVAGARRRQMATIL